MSPELLQILASVATVITFLAAGLVAIIKIARSHKSYTLGIKDGLVKKNYEDAIIDDYVVTLTVRNKSTKTLSIDRLYFGFKNKKSDRDPSIQLEGYGRFEALSYPVLISPKSTAEFHLSAYHVLNRIKPEQFIDTNLYVVINLNGATKPIVKPFANLAERLFTSKIKITKQVSVSK